MDCGVDSNGSDDLSDRVTEISDSAPAIRGKQSSSSRKINQTSPCLP